METAPNVYSDAESSEVVKQNVELGRNLGALMISKAAQKQGATLDWLSRRDAWAVFDDRRVPMTGHYCTESVLASRIVADKQIAKEIMAAAGVSVPVGRRVMSAEDAVQAQRDIGGAVVIKPASGAMGRGVTVNVMGSDDIRGAFSRAAASGGAVLVEQYVRGAEYRAHATPTECVGIFQRLLPSVTGDGQSAVRQLVQRKNELRKLNPATRGQPIPMDDVADGFLRRRGLSWNTIVPLGQRIVIRDVNGITSGGDSEECFDTADESLKRVAAGAIAAIPGMDWGGVDILVQEHTGEPFVVEINTDASINGSTFPVFGTPRDLGSILWRRMYAHSVPDSSRSPAGLVPNSTPREMSSLFRKSRGKDLTLQVLLKGELIRRGRRIVSHNRQVWSAENDHDRSLWFSAVLSGNDRQTSLRYLFRRMQLRQALKRTRIPRPMGRRVRDVEQLRDFQEKVGAPVVLLPLSTRGQSVLPARIVSDEAIDEHAFAHGTSWFAQVYRPGLRLRMAATSDRALVATAPSGQPRPDDSVMERASRLAVLAVRGVPQLRWAFVDVIYRKPKGSDSVQLHAGVEDLSIDPSFDPDDEIVAGSMEAVVDMIIAGASSDPAQS